MKSFCIIGMTGTGKTTEAKNLLKSFPNSNKLIYDINSEYPEFTNGEKLPTIQEFIKKASLANNSIILFEEATIFFSNKKRFEDLVDLLVRKRHTNNIIIFVFHYIAAVPKDIKTMIDFFYIKKTNDDFQDVKKKFKNSAEWILKQIEEGSKENPYFCLKVKGSDL